MQDPWDLLRINPVLVPPVGKKKKKRFGFRVQGWDSSRFWTHADDAYMGHRESLMRSGPAHFTKVSLHKDGTNLFKYQRTGHRIRLKDTTPIDNEWSIALRVEYPRLPVREPAVGRVGFEEDNLIAPKPWPGSQINVTIYSSRVPITHPPPYPYQYGVGPFRKRNGGCFWMMFWEVESTPDRIELAKSLVLQFAGAHASSHEVLTELPPVYHIFGPGEAEVPTILMPPVDFSIIRVVGDEEYEGFQQARVKSLKEAWGR